jgi:uncharacterized heparinase superfamily protein
MATRSALARASRLIEFARHMPMRKLARRVELDVRRRIGDHLGHPLVRLQSDPKRGLAPPAPIFAPRSSALDATGDRLSFTFLNCTIGMPVASIDWDAPSRAPADQLWRMNLHYLEYLEGANTDVWQRLVTAWIADNPPTKRGAWRDSWNSYALSLRVVVLMQELQRRGASLPQAPVNRVEASIVEQLRFLEGNLETDLGGNHLVKNIKALAWASAFFDDANAKRWRQTALRLLDRELGRQILPDGMHDERSASYHAQVFADLMECRHALREDPLHGRLDDALARMAQVTVDLAQPDGGPVLFNDAGLSMSYAPAECLDVYSRLAGRRPEPRRVFALRDAGYFGSRTDRQYLVVDCGRIAPDDLPAHGHGDVLSFEWSVDGRRMIVDQGVFEYNAGERRQWARSATSHNTLSIDGADQADFFGSFRCGRRPNVVVRYYEAGACGFVLEGSHDGFRNLSGSPVHVRRFEADPRSLRIVDRVEGGDHVGASIGFLLHPDVVVTAEDAVVVLACDHAKAIVRCSRRISVVDAVYWPDMGCELPTRRLVVRFEPGDVAVETHLEIL